MARKLRDSRGLTLIELLCAVVILILLGLLLNTGLHMAVKSYQDITVQTESELLLSTLSGALADDLRYARNVTTSELVDAGNPSDSSDDYYRLDNYNSVRYNGQTTLSIEDGRVKATVASSIASAEYPVLPSGSYGNDAYGVPDGGLSISYNEVKKQFIVDLTVRQTDGTISAHTTFTVQCLNPN